MQLFKELQRRNVFRVAIGYVVSSWLLAQVADLVLENIGAPAWVMQTILLVLALGFPVVVFFSWAYEVTPEGIKRDSEVDHSQSITNVTASKLNRSIVAVLIVALAYYFWESRSKPVEQAAGLQPAEQTLTLDVANEIAAENSTDPGSIAVLPFADLSPTGDQGYFSDGIAEEILNVLVHVNGLTVASRTSSFAFKGQDELGIPAIGEALKVRHVLEGSVRSAGDTIRITAQLIDASTDKHLWSQTYDRTLSTETIFAIQDEIASSIVKELASSLQLDRLAGEKVAVKADTENLDAYQLFLQGRQRFRVRGVDNIPGTIEIFQRAIELDPGFARAWAGLAAIAVVAPSWGHPGDGEGNYALAQRAAKQALVLDDTLALPYSVLAYIDDSKLPVDFVSSFDLFEEALKRDPNEVNALLWRGVNLSVVGFFDAAIADLDRCVEIDPGYENCANFGAEARLLAGDYDGAMDLFEQSVGTNSPSRAAPLGLALVTAGDRLSALLAIAWAFEAFNVQIEPELLYRALTDSEFDSDKALREYNAKVKALTGEKPDLLSPGSLLPIIFRRYEDMTPSRLNMYWWHPGLPDFLASPHRKRLIRELGIYDYWRARGFPPQCRPVGDDDFECLGPE